MNTTVPSKLTQGLALCVLLAGCAGTEALVSTPTVDLTSVEMEKVSLRGQSFLLGFEVDNPNAFPLPVRAVKYSVIFDDERFAGGEARASFTFTVPAYGSDACQLSVELDILQSARQITSLLQGGMPEHVNYRVEGSLAVDIPFAKPLPFSSSGTIQVRN